MDCYGLFDRKRGLDVKVDWSQNPEHLQKLEDALGGGFYPLVVWASTISKEGEVLMTVAFHNFGPSGCELSAACFAPHALSAKALREIFHYAYVAMGYRRLSAVVRIDNVRSLEAVRKLGFRVEGYVKNWYPDCDGIFHGMLKEECKWVAHQKL